MRRALLHQAAHDPVRPTETRREHFTLLHEYAHLLIAKDSVVLNWLADRDNPAWEIERLCDEIAATLLVPDDVLNKVVGTGPIKGQHLLDLFQAIPAASQVVCGIALSRRLGCTGAILMTDRRTHTVVHAALVGEPDVYPRTDQALPDGHPLRGIQPGGHICRKSFWTTPWGVRRDYYLDAAASTKRTYAVLADLDLWAIERLHLTPPTAQDTPRPSAHMACSCGFEGVATGWPCTACGQPYCPRCKNCDCARRASLTGLCDRCYLAAPHADLTAGVCSGCR